VSPSLLLHLIILFICLIFSFLFSLAEASLIASSKSKIHKLKQDGSRKAKILDKFLDKKEQLLSLVLFGNNAVNILAASVVTIIALEHIPQEWHIYEYAPLIGSFLLTFIILIFAEITPKTIAINKPESISMSLILFYSVLVKILGPIVSIINRFVAFFLSSLGFKKSINTQGALETLRGEIEYQHIQGAFIKNDKDMLEGVLNLVEMDVESVMTHRKDCDMIDIQSTIEEIADFINQTSHTRLPVYDDTPDEMLGILHLKDFLVLLNTKEEITKEDIKSILLKPLFVPLNIKLKTQLMEFKKKRSHMAIVVDEYGGMMGIVTLADILEEIVGTIEDEHDEAHKNIIEEKENVWIVNGECQIGDFNREIGSHFNHEKASTMAGIVIERAEKIPEEGEEFEIMGFKFTILQKDVSKISLLKIERISNFQEDYDN
jgi:Mg2+/Co2+ transporter CorB